MGASLGVCDPDGQVSVFSTVLPPEASEVRDKLLRLTRDSPFLLRKVHPVHNWVRRCYAALLKGRTQEAKAYLARINAAVQADKRANKDLIRKFDLSRSGRLEIGEFKHFVTYVGFGPILAEQAVREADPEGTGVVSDEAFEAFVGRLGGARVLFQQVRDAVARSADNVAIGLQKGFRVLAHYHDEGMKSTSIADAEVLDVNVHEQIVRLVFRVGNGNNTIMGSMGSLGTMNSEIEKSVTGGGENNRVSISDAVVSKLGEQEVPRDWIVQDLELSEALTNIGIDLDNQHYWTMLLPSPEQYTVMDLASNQMQALQHVRLQAIENHNKAVGPLLKRCQNLGYSHEQLWAVLTWVRDLAPVLVHIDLDMVGPFLLDDTHYRNQFETSSSKGLLCLPKREEWERKLFGTAYDEATPFQRPKYGVLDIMNDHRGALCARDYGDSYLVLKNTRLCCTFSPVDSGGITGERLAVLDQYAHVLLEFSDEELKEVLRIANAEEGSIDRIGDSGKIEGFNYKEAQIHGEIDLKRHVQRIVVHPKHLVDGFSQEKIREVCDKHGWEFMWMQEEKKRRIYEDRMSRDSRTLEMSWASQDCIDILGAKN